MTKVLAQVGTSLADVYDVEGSIAGVDQLVTRDVGLVHEMGKTVFSERFTTGIRGSTSGAVAQNVSWAINLGQTPTTPYRVLAIKISISVTARVSLASVAIQNPTNSREIPIWSWDILNDAETRIRFSDDGGAAGAVIFLQPAPGNVMLPQLLAGSAQPGAIADPGTALVNPSSELIFRGTTDGFGAGTVTANLLYHLGFPSSLGGINSHGLPIPSW